MTDPEDYWRRPTELADAALNGQSTSAPPPPEYSGPPESIPPALDWQPPTLVRVSAPRNLPDQDHESIDREERAAQTVTFTVGMLAAIAILVLLILIFLRLRY